MKSMQQSSLKALLPSCPLLVIAVALLGNTVNNLGSQTVYCTSTPIVQMLQTLRQLLWPRCLGNGGGCPVIRDGIPTRSKGCAWRGEVRQGRTMAERGNHKLQPLSPQRLWPFWLSYMNANALRPAPINTVITTANMATPLPGEAAAPRVFPGPVSKMTACAHEKSRNDPEEGH